MIAQLRMRGGVSDDAIMVAGWQAGELAHYLMAGVGLSGSRDGRCTSSTRRDVTVGAVPAATYAMDALAACTWTSKRCELMQCAQETVRDFVLS